MALSVIRGATNKPADVEALNEWVYPDYSNRSVVSWVSHTEFDRRTSHC